MYVGESLEDVCHSGIGVQTFVFVIVVQTVWCVGLLFVGVLAGAGAGGGECGGGDRYRAGFDTACAEIGATDGSSGGHTSGEQGGGAA